MFALNNPSPNILITSNSHFSTKNFTFSNFLEKSHQSGMTYQWFTISAILKGKYFMFSIAIYRF